MLSSFLCRFRLLPRLIGGFAVLAGLAAAMFFTALGNLSSMESAAVDAASRDAEVRAQADRLIAANPGSALAPELKALSQSLARNVEEGPVRAKSIFNSGLVSIGALLAVGVVFGTWINIAIALSISRAAGRAAALAEAISQGKLTIPVQAQGNDELAVMTRQLEAMRCTLVNIVSKVRGCAENIDTASSEIDAGGRDMGERAERVAANLQRTSSELATLSKALGHTTDSARSADTLAGEAAKTATDGGGAVERMVHTMDSIRQRSTRIQDIIGVIDGLAFQTNILALNAAVESARAGEHGRGFAVVANEVRALAHRSADASKEIRTLIQQSNEAVSAGGEVATDAGQRMGQIVSAVGTVSALVAQISNSAAQQGQSIDQLNTALGEVDSMAQGNAALVEQTAAAVQSLRGQAAELAQQVRFFQL